MKPVNEVINEDIMATQLNDGTVVYLFIGQKHPFSNFAKFNFMYQGRKYSCVEQAFVLIKAQRQTTNRQRNYVIRAASVNNRDGIYYKKAGKCPYSEFSDYSLLKKLVIFNTKLTIF